jgi:hypothetical protein
MRSVRRVMLLAMLTVAGTFMPPYPSNANFPPAPPAQTSTDVSSDPAELPPTSGFYTVQHR